MRGSDAETVLGGGPGRGSSASEPDEANGSRLRPPVGKSIKHTCAHRLVLSRNAYLPAD